MNRYIQVRDGIVAEVIADNVSAFPNVPASERYAVDFLASCILVTDDAVAVETGYTYDPYTGNFLAPSNSSTTPKTITLASRVQSLESENPSLKTQIEASQVAIDYLLLNNL